MTTPWQDDFDEFVRVYSRSLRAAVGAMARRFGQEADDVLQEALLRAYANRDAFESEAHAVNWIGKVAHDLLCDQRRSWYGRRVAATDTLPERETAPDPADLVARRESGRHVRRALAALPPAYRLLLWEHAVDGRSYADIARDTARPLATVRSTALRARAAARRHLLAGESTFGAAVAIRVRGWWGRVATGPTEPVAAVLALTLCLGTLAAPPAAAAAPPAGTRHVAGAVAGARVPEPVAVPRRAAARPAGPAPAPALDVRTPGPAPTPAPLATGRGATSGERWGSCAFGAAPPPSGLTPLLALTEAGTYACHVDARSTACRTAPNHSTEDGTTCSWSVRGDFTGQTRGLPVTARLCNPGPGVGAFVVTLDGVGSYEAPGSLFLNDDGVLAQLSFDAGDRHVSLSLRIPFLCAEQNPAAPVVTGQIWVD